MSNAIVDHPDPARRLTNASSAIGSIGVARIAGALFITATTATMISQVMMEPLIGGADLSDAADSFRGTLAVAALLEITNALASAGIAISLYPILRCYAELPATGYLGMRLIEAAAGVAAAVGLILLLETASPLTQFAVAMHDWMFLLVLVVFSVGTFLFYPMLFRFGIVPRVLSVWGLIGGVMLLVSCVSILFGWIEMGGTTDLLLSLPIWINEMALAIWLIVKGFNLSHLPGAHL
ncbi:MAG: DUF4386 domain-containing protein [Pseudomonadota bacterium]